jgi:hypothetical protein
MPFITMIIFSWGLSCLPVDCWKCCGIDYGLGGGCSKTSFIGSILVILVGCNLQLSAAMLVIQVGMCEACFTGLYFPKLDRTHVYPLVPINSINLLKKVSEVFFSLCVIYYAQTLSPFIGSF